MLAAALAAIILLAAGLLWRSVSDERAGDAPIAQRSSARAMEVIRAPAEPPEPTPIFASRGKVTMRLPVAVNDLTEVGFHQASYDYAKSMKTPLPDADMTAAKKNKGTDRDVALQETGPDAVLVGSVLRMWRDRPGKPNTAVDVGAEPGSAVYSPIDGTVLLVKSYDLYGKYPDVRVHLRPDGNPNLDCVMIHIEDPTVRAGDRVVSGVTRIGSVRRLSDRMRLQLTSYTPDDGDHVHIQLNDVTDPDYKGLDGATASSGS